MTDDWSAADESVGRPAEESASRTATIRTEVADAETLAASVQPDNTPEIDTRVERGSAENGDADGDADGGLGVVVTNVERGTTGGLRTTVDDYVVNLTVARDVVQVAKRHANDQTDNTQS